MTSLPTRLSDHYLVHARDGQDCEDCTREMLRLLAAELVVAGHRDAARWLLSQLVAEVIPLRPEPEGAA